MYSTPTVLPETPELPFIDIPGPTPGTELTRAHIETIGRLAYLWGWPLVNGFNRRAAMASIPEPGLRAGVLPVAPIGRLAMLTDYISPAQRYVTCPNQDVVYGLGYGALDDQPVVLQVPDFGDRFWMCAAWDARTDAFAKLGSRYATPPGFYLLVGPDWNDKVPDGIAGAFRSPTDLVAFCPRIFLAETVDDRRAIQPVLDRVLAYPLREFDGAWKTKDWAKAPSFPGDVGHGDDEVRWVQPDKFFDQLRDVLKGVPPLPVEIALYGQIDAVLEAAARNPAVKQLLDETAAIAERELIDPLFHWRHVGPPAGNGWYSPKNNGQYGTDYAVRTAVAKSNMYENHYRETKYLFTEEDFEGRPLHGNTQYAITFDAGQLPPVAGFWSLTLYNAHHFFHPNRARRYSLGTKSPELQYNPDGSLTVYAGSHSPGRDQEPNWLPAPEGPFSLFLRAYGPGDAIVEGHWIPPKVVERATYH